MRSNENKTTGNIGATSVDKMLRTQVVKRRFTMKRTGFLTTWWLPLLLLTIMPLASAWAAGTPAGTVISNHATLSYNDANGNALQQISSNIVTTIVSQVAGVDVSPAVSAGSIAANSSVHYHVNVTNIGNGSDTFDLTVSSLPAGWTATLYYDTNGNDALDLAEMVPGNVMSSMSLDADSSDEVHMHVTAPEDATNETVVPTTVTATSQFDDGVSDLGTYTSTVQTAVLTLTKSASPTNPKPGDIVTYTLYGENAGSAIAYDVAITDELPTGVTYVPGSIRYGIGAEVTYDTATPATDTDDAPDVADFGITTANAVTVNWGDSPTGQTGAIFFRVQVNSGIAAGSVIGNLASVDYSSTSGGASLPSISSNTGNITVAASPAITLSTTASSGTGQPSDSLWYQIILTNAGNSTDEFDLSLSTTLGFESITWLDANKDGIPGNDGDHILTDDHNDGNLDTGDLAAGTSINLIVVVIVTPGTGDMSIDNTTINMNSEIDENVTAIVTLTTTAYAPILAIIKTVSPSGPQPPQTVLTYSVSMTNTGHGLATGLQLIDIVPVNTTFVSGSIKVDGSARTDAADGDNATVQGSSVIADFPALGAGGSRALSFQAQID
jgi:trimeric autotransporter adhesin